VNGDLAREKSEKITAPSQASICAVIVTEWRQVVKSQHMSKWDKSLFFYGYLLSYNKVNQHLLKSMPG
jgi:hypothetical protein